MSNLILTSSETPIDPPVGVHENIPFEEYLSWNCFSKSMTSAALKSGYRLQNSIINGKKTKSLGFGSLVDCLVLEPKLLDSRYTARPSTYKTSVSTGRAPNKETKIVEKPWDLRSTTCKEIHADIIASGKSMVSQEDLERARSIRVSIFENDEAARAISKGSRQVSMVWIDEETGVKCKGRTDIIHDCIYDLKTSVDASEDGFQAFIGKFLYHVQGGVYTGAWEQLTGQKLDFKFIVAETSWDTDEPLVALYRLKHESIVAGRLMFKRALRNVANWLEHGVSGYSKEFEDIGAPRWMLNREFDLTDEENQSFEM